MSIEKRGRASWRVEVVQIDPVTGDKVRVQQTIRGTKRTAQTVEAQLKADRSRGIDLDPEDVTFSELAERWQTHWQHQVAASTFAGYRTRAQRAVRSLGRLKLRDLKAIHITSYHSELLADGLAPQTVVHHHRVVSQMLTWAVEMELLDRNPATIKAARPPRAERRSLNTLDGPAARQLMNVLADEGQKRMVRFALETGMRIGEQCGLKWSDVDLDRGLAVVQRSIRVKYGKVIVAGPKTKKSTRPVALGPATVAVLREQRLAQKEAQLRAFGAYDTESDWVWTDELGGVRSPDAVSLRFSRTVRPAGFEGLRWHDLRHSHATISIAAGNNIKLVSERLGHSTPAFTLATYVHTTDNAHAAAAALFESALAL